MILPFGLSKLALRIKFRQWKNRYIFILLGQLISLLQDCDLLLQFSSSPPSVEHASVVQFTPPCWAAVPTSRVLLCVPPLHVELQSPQAPHSAHVQSTRNYFVMVWIMIWNRKILLTFIKMRIESKYFLTRTWLYVTSLWLRVTSFTIGSSMQRLLCFSSCPTLSSISTRMATRLPIFPISPFAVYFKNDEKVTKPSFYLIVS